MRRQKKSTTTVDIFYLECFINKLIRNNTGVKLNTQMLKPQLETHINLQKQKQKQNTQPTEQKQQSKCIQIHSYRPQSENHYRKYTITNHETKPAQKIKNNILHQQQKLLQTIKQQNNLSLNETAMPLVINKKPIRNIFSNQTNRQSTNNTSRTNSNLINYSKFSNFSPSRTITDRFTYNQNLTGWQTSDETEWI